MCGIFATVAAGAEGVDPAGLQRALDALRHRGPDGDGIWVSPSLRAGLAHTRLAIIGIADGAQPMSNETGALHLVVNGEFYDFERIRAELEKKGHKFKSSADSEIALHLYEEHGLDFVCHLRGEFALLLWDENARRLVAVRDRFGIKPLCYAWSGGRLYLASEAKALFAAGLPARWDMQSFFHAATLQYVLPDRTLFDGVRQLPPGHMLVVDDGQPRSVKYWDLDYGAETSKAADEAGILAEFAGRLEQAVQLRLRADIPVCCHLSGGLDSAAVAGIAARHLPYQLSCFTVSFEHAEYDELPVAAEMARFAGAALHPVPVSQRQIIEALPDAVYFSEGLAVNGHLPAKYILNKEIRRAGFKVALTGEGADEVMAGYAHLRSDLFAVESRHDLIMSLKESNRASSGIMLAHGQSLSLDAVLSRLDFVPSFLLAKGSLGYKMRAILDSRFARLFAHEDPFASLLDSFDLDGQLRGRHVVYQSLYLWCKTALANYILNTLGDGTEMASAVEGRLPYLDHELFAFIRSLPLSMKIRDTREKYALREAARPFVTATIYERQKHPFVAPPVSRYRDRDADAAIQDTLRSRSFSSLPFFDRKKVYRLLDRLDAMDEAERGATDPVLMTALSACALQERLGLEAPR